VTLPLPTGVSLGRVWRGDGRGTSRSAFELQLPASDACVLELQRVSLRSSTDVGADAPLDLRQHSPATSE
jgi:hypothetical protein